MRKKNTNRNFCSRYCGRSRGCNTLGISSFILTAKFVELTISTAKRPASFKTAIIIGCIIKTTKFPASTVCAAIAILSIVLTTKRRIKAIFTTLEKLIIEEVKKEIFRGNSE